MENFEQPKERATSLERVSEQDMDTLLELSARMPAANGYSPLNEDEWKQEFEKGAVSFIKNGDDPVGFFAYEQKTPAYIYISEIAVLPEYRGKGIAPTALSNFIAEHPEVKRFDLTTHPDNEPALGLYKSLGFQIESRTENYYGDGEPRFILAWVRV